MHWQITLPMLLLFIVAAITGSYILRIVVQNNLKTEFLHRGQLAAHSVQYAVETASNNSGIQRYVAALGAEDDFDLVIVVAGHPARIIASTERVLIGVKLSEITTIDGVGRITVVTEKRASEYEFSIKTNQLTYISPILISNIFSNKEALGEGALLLKMRTGSLAAAVNRTLIILISLLIFLLVILAFILLLLVRRHVIRPQERLMSTVKSRQKGEKVLTKIVGNNEFAELGEAFNEMLLAADSVDKLKSEFVSTVSHELRTPLTSISGAIKLVLARMSNNIPEKGLGLLEMANRNSERLTLLINDILDLEKLTSGELEFNYQQVDLVELAKNAMESNNGFALKHKVSLCLKKTLDSAQVKADGDRLLQVFANLLSNAIKYSPPGEEVWIEITENNGVYRVTVKDFGSGIPGEFKSRIFQRFAQADSSDTREKGGTGLGLNISKTIIECHNGTIGFDSEKSMGAEFYFDLPRERND